MTNANQARFQLRLELIEEQRLATLAVAERIARPRRAGLIRAALRSLAIGYLTVAIIKVVILVQIGSAAYDSHIIRLKSGSPVDVVGAVVFGVDPLTGWIVSRIGA